MKQLLLLLILLSSVIAQADTFDPATNTLTMESVTVGNQKFFNVVIRIDQYAVLGVGSSVPIDSGISETCGAVNFKNDKFNAIQIGMPIDQVNQIIGCKPNPNTTVRSNGHAMYQWNSIPAYQSITVIFEESSLKVTGLAGSSFKMSTGL